MILALRPGSLGFGRIEVATFLTAGPVSPPHAFTGRASMFAVRAMLGRRPTGLSPPDPAAVGFLACANGRERQDSIQKWTADQHIGAVVDI